MDEIKYLHRRQFILSPKDIPYLNTWQKEKLSNGYTIAVHPDLEFQRIENTKFTIILLGYIIDPYNPQLNNYEVLECIAETSKDIDDIPKATLNFGGRYALLLVKEKEMRIYHDAAGLRSVFYCIIDDQVWCASQVSLLAEVNNQKIDQTLKDELREIQSFKNESEFWYPGSLTAYKEIKQLLPNHYLNVMTGNMLRYWPSEYLAALHKNKGVDIVSTILSGMLIAASQRFKIGFAITAGLDSRMVLAASKPIKHKLRYITHTYPGCLADHDDIVIPSRLLPEFNLNHEIINFSPKIEFDFSQIFNKNIPQFRQEKKRNAFTFYKYFKELNEELVIMNGVCGEIGRNFYNIPSFLQLNSKVLSILTGMRNNERAMSEFSIWLEGVNYSQRLGYRLLDLFYWEQRIGKWASQSFNEYDITCESFSPFNCRALINTMLCVKKSLRDPPLYKFQKSIIEKLWPELLKVEINPPHGIKKTLKQQNLILPIYNLLKGMNLIFVKQYDLPVLSKKWFAMKKIFTK